MSKKRWLIYLLTWISQALLWLAFTNSLGFREIIASVIAATIAVLATAVFADKAKTRFQFRLGDLIQVWRLPGYALSGTWEILHGLVQQMFTRAGASSVLSAVPFDTGGADAESAARRALAVTYTTVTPNSIVLGIVVEQRFLLLHQILPGELHALTCKLGAPP